jgi:hypothetical protein
MLTIIWCGVADWKRYNAMARLLFFLFAAAFCVAAACFPLQSKSDSTWADVTFGIACEDHGTGIWHDRQFDFPTGAGYYIDIPAWVLDTGLFVGTAAAFGFYAKGKLRAQAV